MQIKTEIQQTASTFYISIDNQKFTRKYDCLLHEAKWYKENRHRDIETEYDISYDEYPMHLYHVKDEEDYEYLVHTEWFYNATDREYVGPGWYLDIIHDGGDSYDWHEIMPLDQYLKEMQEYINRIKDLTKS